MFRAGIGSLYNTGSKSWMVDPDTVRGSDGTAVATLSEGATQLTLFGRNQGPGVISRVQVLDDGGAMIQEFNLTHLNWTRIEVTRNSGDPLIGSVQVENMSGGTMNDLMVAIDDFSYSTDPVGTGGSGTGGTTSSNDDSSSAGPLMLLLLSVGWLASLMRRRR